MAVTVYVKNECPFCRRLCEQLVARGVRAIRIDVDIHPEVVPELLKLTGGRRVVPVLIEGVRIEVAPSGGTEF